MRSLRSRACQSHRKEEEEEEEGVEGKFGPRLRFPAISAPIQLVPGPSRLSSVPNLEYDAAVENVSGPR